MSKKAIIPDFVYQDSKTFSAARNLYPAYEKTCEDIMSNAYQVGFEISNFEAARCTLKHPSGATILGYLLEYVVPFWELHGTALSEIPLRFVFVEGDALPRLMSEKMEESEFYKNLSIIPLAQLQPFEGIPVGSNIRRDCLLHVKSKQPATLLLTEANSEGKRIVWIPDQSFTYRGPASFFQNTLHSRFITDVAMSSRMAELWNNTLKPWLHFNAVLAEYNVVQSVCEFANREPTLPITEQYGSHVLKLSNVLDLTPLAQYDVFVEMLETVGYMPLYLPGYCLHSSLTPDNNYQFTAEPLHTFHRKNKHNGTVVSTSRPFATNIAFSDNAKTYSIEDAVDAYKELIDTAYLVLRG